MPTARRHRAVIADRESVMLTTATDRSSRRNVERAVLWGAFPVGVGCLLWLIGSSRPFAPATVFVLLFGLSAGVQIRRAVRREGVEREIMLRSAAISYPIVTTTLVLALVTDLAGVVDASTALVVTLVVALLVQSVVEGVLERRLG
jgi:hypothetical protein